MIPLDDGLRLGCWKVRADAGKPIQKLGQQSRQGMVDWVRVVAVEGGETYILNIFSV